MFSPDFVASIGGAVLVAGLSLPHILLQARKLSLKRSQYQHVANSYSDGDGIASEESEAAFSAFVPTLISLLASVTGALVALALGVVATVDEEPIQKAQWLLFGSWIFILIQEIIIFITTSPNKRCLLGAWSALACVVLIAVITTLEAFLLRSGLSLRSPTIHFDLSISQFFIANIVLFSNILIPRRPDVFVNGKLVDRERTVSFLGKYTFSWAGEILALGAKNGRLDPENLPSIGNEVRSKTLYARFEEFKTVDSLWKKLLLLNKAALFEQLILMIASSIFSFLPQIMLYNVLRRLEARDAGDANNSLLWFSVLGLGASTVASSLFESQLVWNVFLRVGLPMLGQLSIVVYGKALRRKDVRGAIKTEGNDDVQSTSEDSDDANDAGNEAGAPKTKQSTINLISVDSNRVVYLAQDGYLFLDSIVKIAFSITFLMKLIGWKPLLCGAAAPLLLTPFNYYITKKYTIAEESLMELRDKSVGVITEALQGIRQIKFGALEKNWYEKIMAFRRQQIAQQKRIFILDLGFISVWSLGPVCLSAISLTAYAIINGSLSASVAFTTISVYEGMKLALTIIPELITVLLNALVSMNRIQEYLNLPEHTDHSSPSTKISFTNATLAWPSDAPELSEGQFQLRNINIQVPPNSLTLISGRTGSGKSLLLSSLIGEADLLHGHMTIPQPPSPNLRFDHKANKSDWILENSIAYVSQTPWIENMSLRDNITFGLPFDEDRYNEVIHACALEKDIELLESGDMTDIGANGINLSGGQKWRTTFARALYSRAGILVLDDIFSAVDAHVGRHLFEVALTGKLGNGRTRILATHHVGLCLSKAQYSILLDEGTVSAAGPTKELCQRGIFDDALAHTLTASETTQNKPEDTPDISREYGQPTESGDLVSLPMDTPSDVLQSDNATATAVKSTTPPRKFVEDEKRATGSVKTEVYKAFLKACGGYAYWCVVAFFLILTLLDELAIPFWASIWTREYDESVSETSFYQQSVTFKQHIQGKFQALRTNHSLIFYAGIYIGISLFSWLLELIRFCFIFYGTIQGSVSLYEKITSNILQAPLRFLDTTPVGRILNRFTGDFEKFDSEVGTDLSYLLKDTLTLFAVVIAGISASPVMLAFGFILLLSSWYFASLYLISARDVNRLESNAKSPIFELFGSVLTGIGTVRAYDKAELYMEKMFERIDAHCQSLWYLRLFNRWMSFRLEMLGAMFVTATAALIVGLGNVDAPLAGFILSFSLQMSEVVIWVLRQYAEVEIDFNAVERITEYTAIPVEPDKGENAPAAWPTKGELEFHELVTSYAPHLPPVLKGVSFSVHQNERIGIVGRTGAGKSSLTLALFRFLDINPGSIYIDGIDISTIKLHDLRSRLAIIPQDPVLFSGTVRSNLDPFNQYTDENLLDALRRVHLTSTDREAEEDNIPVSASSASEVSSDLSSKGSNQPITLFSPISESGLNLSQGERQLLCLARAIVARPKILVLDEATSSVDMRTDALIQKSIREEFSNSTLIVIAHRLSTISDFDRIVVMGEGRVVEFDTPRALMEIEGGLFKDMVDKSGESDTLKNVIYGNSSD